jgi:transposase InsO family protein
MPMACPHFNTDQGSQFTSPRFTRMLKEAKVRIFMDGKGRWIDNVFIERLRLPQPSLMPCWPPAGASTQYPKWVSQDCTIGVGLAMIQPRDDS